MELSPCAFREHYTLGPRTLEGRPHLWSSGRTGEEPTSSSDTLMTASGLAGRDNGQADPFQGQKELTWPEQMCRERTS